jgi:hypothetical protein
MVLVPLESVLKREVADPDVSFAGGTWSMTKIDYDSHQIAGPKIARRPNSGPSS